MALRWAAAAVSLILFASACAHQSPVTQRVPVPTPPKPTPPADPVASLIENADGRLAAGARELQAGHLDAARREFDTALDAYLTYPGGAQSDPRLAEAYRRTLDAIQTQELTALAAGDGFRELPEPAAIDEVAELPLPQGPADEEVRRAAEAAVEQETNDLPLQLNDAVLGCVQLYQGPLRSWFAAALQRGGRYLPHIREVFAAEGIPQDLAYLALVESAFRPAALSRARARGVWQFIADTGRRYGLQQDWWIDERSDPEKSTRAAARYLKELYAIFGDWNLAMAAYNAGEYGLLRSVNRYGVKDFWELSKTRALRRETRNYVPMIQAAVLVAKAPERYGFDVTLDPPAAYEAVPVKGAVDLRLVAECAKTSLDEIRDLNPALRRLATPGNANFDVKVPKGTGLDALECIEATPAERRVRFRTHVVARGQTLATIARRYGTGPREVADANSLSIGRPLAVGTELIIPIDPGRAPAVQAPPAAARTADAGTGARVSYRVKPGDTLGAIATQYRTTVRDLQTWNRLSGTRIDVGSLLTIYTAR
jgi:membrane-bound lytic murein transglycosylase D